MSNESESASNHAHLHAPMLSVIIDRTDRKSIGLWHVTWSSGVHGPCGAATARDSSSRLSTQFVTKSQRRAKAIGLRVPGIGHYYSAKVSVELYSDYITSLRSLVIVRGSRNPRGWHHPTQRLLQPASPVRIRVMTLNALADLSPLQAQARTQQIINTCHLDANISSYLLVISRRRSEVSLSAAAHYRSCRRHLRPSMGCRS